MESRSFTILSFSHTKSRWIPGRTILSFLTWFSRAMTVLIAPRTPTRLLDRRFRPGRGYAWPRQRDRTYSRASAVFSRRVELLSRTYRSASDLPERTNTGDEEGS